jgi:16S rRNA (uracil1498-N3)-methyltransferase
VPQVTSPVATRDLAGQVAAAACALVLHEGATTVLTEVTLPHAGEILLVVGPEGGITAEEVAGFEARGAVACRLGPHVLRSSTAGPAALAVLSAAVRWR